MTNSSNKDAMLVGGPCDGEQRATEGTALLEIEIDGLVHRYIHTSQERDSKTVYNYDGVVDPSGAENGIENSAERVNKSLTTE